jgi:hypothetical protein
VLANAGRVLGNGNAVAELHALRGVGRELSVAADFPALTELARVVPGAGHRMPLPYDVSQRPPSARLFHDDFYVFVGLRGHR